jgi:hypothetical protein
LTATTPELGLTEAALFEVRVELTRADQKAATLLALFSAISAGVLAVFATRKGGVFSLWNGVEWMVWIGVTLLGCSLINLLFCVRPEGAARLQGNSYFAFYAQYAERADELCAYLAAETGRDEERCAQLVELSVLAKKKYRLIARGVDLLGWSLTLIAAATLLDALQ